MTEFKLGLYRHFKGAVYHAFAVSRSGEDAEDVVLYRRAEGSTIWHRTITNFLETVERPEGVFQSRFVLMTPDMSTNLLFK